MSLSILIVTYNSRAHIDACLESLAEACEGLRAEICVIDNASSDGTADHVRRQHPSVVVAALPTNDGFAAGINRGLRETTGDFVLWLNPDAAFIGGRIADVIAWLGLHPEVGIVGGRMRDPDGTVQRSVRAFPTYESVLGARHGLLTKLFPKNPFAVKYLRGDISYDEPARADWVSGACLLHRRAVSDALGGLDDGYFMYFEDVDFCYHALARGWQTWFHPGMTFRHAIGGSSDPVKYRMLIARHRSMWRWYTKTFHRMIIKDALVWCGIWVRCGAFMLAGALRRSGR